MLRFLHCCINVCLDVVCVFRFLHCYEQFRLSIPEIVCDTLLKPQKICLCRIRIMIRMRVTYGSGGLQKEGARVRCQIWQWGMQDMLVKDQVQLCHDMRDRVSYVTSAPEQMRPNHARDHG